jgi:hypothetical protein
MQHLIETMKVLNLLKVAFPHIQRERKPEELAATFDVYAQLLDDLEPDLLKTAALQLASESKWFPAISELRERVLAMRKSADDTPDWTLAWEDVQHAIRRFGYEEGMRRDLHIFQHDATETAVRRLGWRAICMCEEDNLNTMRAQFRDVFQIMVKRAEDDARLLPATRQQISRLADALSINTPRPRLNGGTNGRTD